MHPSFLYGRVITNDGTTYEGRLRWGGGEEAFWGNYFNGVKDENPWGAEVPPEQLMAEREPLDLFGVEIKRGEGPIDLSRPFMARMGDIARVEAFGHSLPVAREGGIEYDPTVRVTLKSGTIFDLDRLSASDFDDGVRVWDGRRGVVDLRPRRIRVIELLPSTQPGKVPDRLHGTVHTRRGSFTGFLQWDREEALGRDELVGYADDEERRLPFHSIRAIVRHGRSHSIVTLHDGDEVMLSGTRKVGRNNRGVYVDDRRYGRVLVTWDAFERVDFSPGGSGPTYEDFPPGHPLMGTVTTHAGQRFTGRLVYDLDESETTETLDAPSEGVDYTIPFGMVASIVLPDGDERAGRRATVALQSGEVLELERSGDLGERNAGLLVFADGQERPAYVPWTDVQRIDFDRPPTMYPPVGKH